MLASITPLGERSRRQPWAVTVAAQLFGATLGGAATGALLAACGALLPAGSAWRLMALAVVVLAGVALETAVGVPTHRRQVDETWLHRYRGWVYGVGFGAQLGTGLATVVSTFAVYATLAAALLAPSVPDGALIGATFGAVRGVTPLLAIRVVHPVRLADFHRRLVRWDGPARRVAIGGQAALGAIAVLVAL